MKEVLDRWYFSLQPLDGPSPRVGTVLDLSTSIELSLLIKQGNIVNQHVSGFYRDGWLKLFEECENCVNISR